MGTKSNSIWQALSDEFTQVIESAQPSIAAVNSGRRQTYSAVCIEPGVFVTAEHAVRNVRTEEKVTIILSESKTIQASVAGRDTATDIAVLKTKEASGIAARMATQNSKAGEVVLALARSREGELAASAGIVGRAGSAWRTWRGAQIDQFVRPDVRFYPSFSGGPLVNRAGEMLGINTLGLTRGPAVTIPAGTVQRVATELLRSGRVARPYLGLAMQPVRLPEDVVKASGMNGETGLMVLRAERQGPAKKAGITLGDILISLGGQPVSDIDDVQEWLLSANVGQAVPAVVIRGGEKKEFVVSLEAQSLEAQSVETRN